MSARTKKNTVETVEEQTTPAAQEEQSETPGDPATETEAAENARKQEAQIKTFLSKLPDPCVYCGPSVRGVARQYTVYNGGIPDVVKQFITEHPAAKGLLVSVERFAQVRIKLETRGTAEFILFNKVRAEL